MSEKINFFALCESVLNEADLILLEAQIQKQSRFEELIASIAQKVKEIVDKELEQGRRTKRPELVKLGQDRLFKLRTRLIRLLNASRQKAAAIRKVEARPYTKEEVDNFINTYVSRGGIFDVFGKLRSDQFGEDQFPQPQTKAKPQPTTQPK